MDIKLHNKFEIICGDKTYTAYNTLTQKAIENIANFNQIATYFAFGTGTTTVSYQDYKMSNYTTSYPTVLEELQNDLSNGNVYVKRTLSFSESQAVGLEFCELGITNSSDYNPNICNHIQIKDDNDNIVTIRKREGQKLFIRVTIYLSINSNAQKMFVLGQNRLISALLGEYSGNKIFTIMKGNVLVNNANSIYRNTPREGTSYTCTKTATTSNLGYNINLDFDLLQGETSELVILLDGLPVIRYSTLEMATISSQKETLTSQTNYTITLSSNNSGIIQIEDEGTEITGYATKKFATDFSDYITNPFAESFTASMPRWVSDDGDKIAFISANTLCIYQNSNYQLTKLANNINTQNLQKVIMFEDNVFVIYNAEPHIAMYKINNGILERKQINLANYDSFDDTYDWQDIVIISNKSTQFMFGIILGSISRRPVIVNATYANNVLTINNANYGQTDYICSIFSLYHNNFCNSMIGFITNNYNLQENNCRIEEHYLEGTYNISHEMTAYYLSRDTIDIKGKTRAIVATRTSAPNIWLYYYPQAYRYSISLTDVTNNWVSTNLLYLIQKFDNQDYLYKIYSLSDYNNPIEFENGFPQEINQAQIVDFEFLADTLLIFTQTTTYALNLKETKTIIENLPTNNHSYEVTYNKQTLLGEPEDEGVTGTITIGVNV